MKLSKRNRAIPRLLLAALLSALVAPTPATAQAAPLTVLSYNIHHGAGTDDVLDLARVADTIRATGAQVVGLQEVDRHWSERSAFADQADELAELLDMEAVYAPNLDLDPAVPGQPRRQYGTAILSSYDIVAWENTLLPKLGNHEQRGLLEAVIDVGGAPLRVYNTHLQHNDAGERGLQTAAILDRIAQRPELAVLTGDFNARPEDAEMTGLLARFTDAAAAAGPTYPAETATARIDYVLADPRIEAVGAQVLVSHASDHLPVFADLVLPAEGACTITGSAASELLVGTDGDDVICAGGGDDRIRAGTGSDIVLAGDGDDRVVAGDGDDVVAGGPGDDVVRGDAGNDDLDGGEGTDRVIGGSGNDDLSGGEGDDRLIGGSGDDALDGGPGDDRCFGWTGTDRTEHCERTDGAEQVSAGPLTATRGQPAPTVEFVAPADGEGLVDLTVGAPGVRFDRPGAESAVLALRVDGRLAGHLVVTSQAPTRRRVALGPVTAGSHRLEIAFVDESPAGAVSAVLDEVTPIVVPSTDPGYLTLRHAPVLYGRTNPELGSPFQNATTDVPLIAWHETQTATVPGNTVLEYSVVWSNEDGGTNSPALMARWGRTTDIEWIYRVEVDPAGEVVPGTAVFQGANHATTPFTGTYERDHALLQTCTSNNNLCQYQAGPTASPMRFHLAYGDTRPAQRAREYLMDRNPWTYQVMAWELLREGRVEVPSDPATPEVGDQRTYLWVEVDKDTLRTIPGERAALAVGVRLFGDPTVYRSDHGNPSWAIDRDLPAATTVELPESTTAADIEAIEVHRLGLAPETSTAIRVTDLERAFFLDADYLPQASFASWHGEVVLQPGAETATVWPIFERPALPADATAQAFERITRATAWETVTAVPLQFDAEHPQGMVRIGDAYYMSSVEILESTVRYPVPIGGYDRTPGAGVGHLYKFDTQGNLLGDLVLGEGMMYHPGGIDFDGTHLWVPVAEYRPNSKAIVYRVDPVTMTAQEVFRVADHIGGIVHDVEAGELHGVSWGSRAMYRWTATGQLLGLQANPSHFVDYQDCHVAGGRTMLCSGITGLTGPGGAFQLGGLALIDLVDLTIRHEVPISRYSGLGNVLTRNPVFTEALPNGGLRLHAVPDDDQSPTLYVLDTVLPPQVP